MMYVKLKCLLKTYYGIYWGVIKFGVNCCKGAAQLLV